MASQSSKAQKSSSKWGSFLAGVESRLDTILADEDTAKAAAQRRKDGGSQEPPIKRDSTPAGLSEKEGSSRTPSANRAQDRLNEKLAKAMGNKNALKKESASVSTSGVPSRTASLVNLVISPRPSSDLRRDSKDMSARASAEMTSPGDTVTTNGADQDEAASKETSQEIVSREELPTQSPIIAIDEVKDYEIGTQPSVDSRGPASASRSLDLTRDTTPGALESPKTNGISVDSDPHGPEHYENIIVQLRSDNEAADLRRQEETHTFLEQIDAMQAKLQYLTKEAAEISKKSKEESLPGSLEQRLAVKDEKIALLIEEGQKLSQTELKHMSIIKRLRAKASEDERILSDSKGTLEKQEKTASEAQERAKRAEAVEKRATERIISLIKVEKDLVQAKSDIKAKDTLIQDLQIQLSQATSAAKEAELKINTEALEKEQRRVKDLAEELSGEKTEKDLSERQHLDELREIREKTERERERARAAEIEREGEQRILESRLEAYRARAEEASAGQGGDVQTKLLRQIETLQNQYAVASENWQGIEGSLLSRVTALETERDEIAKRETDIRRKARENNTKFRRIEEELEKYRAQSQDMLDEVSSREKNLQNLQEKLSKAEADAIATRNDLKAERETWDARLAQRLEDERAQIREETERSTPELYQHFRTDSPITHTGARKFSNGDRNLAHDRRVQGLAISGTGNPSLERPLSRRSSNQPLSALQISEHHSQRLISRNDSTSTVPQVSINHGIPETPSMTGKDDDFFSGFQTPATPDRTINDVISASTAGAGPSVQLVERMSAAVRRLESEKAEHKDELSRLATQRDEARDQMLGMMKEVEEKRGWEARVKEVEGSLKTVEERYLTTLELLGEKSEKVEELKADVEDLKGMYRELVESTMK